MSVRNVISLVVVLGLIGASIGAFFFGGYLIGKYHFRPAYTLGNVEKKLFKDSLQKMAQKGELNNKQFETIFLRLSSESSTVPAVRAGAGGGLTSFGDAVLLITHEGKIYSARSAGEIEETAIEAPENGLFAYQKAAVSERFRDLSHRFLRFRYNDIIYYQSNSKRGLAVSYTEFIEASDCYGTAVAVLALDPHIHAAEQISARKEDWDVIYRTQPCLPLKEQGWAIDGESAGGRITFRSPATIYLASGDYHWDGVNAPEELAQNPDNDYGKVIAIDLDSGQARTVSSGHRNMQGIVFDRHGTLWVVEHGPRGGDELNLVVEGTDYGWPKETLGTRYNNLPFPNTISYGRHETFMAPTYAWLPSVAISSLTLIEGFHDSWDGDLLMASLKRKSLFRIRVKDDRVLFAERINMHTRIRYVHQHSDGRLVLWTDDRNLVFLTVAKNGFAAEFVEEYIANASYNDAQRNRVKAAMNSCMECHSLEPDAHSNAPSLAMVFGAPIGKTSFGGYSEALRKRNGRWSREELLAFLGDPKAYAPGTSMPDPGVGDAFVLGELVNILEAITSRPAGE